MMGVWNDEGREHTNQMNRTWYNIQNMNTMTFISLFWSLDNKVE